MTTHKTTRRPTRRAMARKSSRLGAVLGFTAIGALCSVMLFGLALSELKRQERMQSDRDWLAYCEVHPTHCTK